jgi:hypothetical protein
MPIVTEFPTVVYTNEQAAKKSKAERRARIRRSVDILLFATAIIIVSHILRWNVTVRVFIVVRNFIRLCYLLRSVFWLRTMQLGATKSSSSWTVQTTLHSGGNNPNSSVSCESSSFLPPSPLASFWEPPSAGPALSSSILASLIVFILKDFIQKILALYLALEQAASWEKVLLILLFIASITSLFLLVLGNSLCLLISFLLQGMLLIGLLFHVAYAFYS